MWHVNLPLNRNTKNKILWKLRHSSNALHISCTTHPLTIHSSQPRPTATFPLFVVGMCSSSIRVDSSVSQSPERLHPRPSFAVRGWHEQRDLDRYSSLHHIACNNPPMGCPSYVPRTNQSPVPLYYHVPATTDFFFFSVPFQYPLCVSEGGESLYIYVAGDYDDNDSDGDGTWHEPTSDYEG